MYRMSDIVQDYRVQMLPGYRVTRYVLQVIVLHVYVTGLQQMCYMLQGYKMDDLLTSYISLMLTNMNRQKRQ